jgi:uncharacterized 2Fe-2S/4Fe-4S cluster protein (DUF4445 family)
VDLEPSTEGAAVHIVFQPNGRQGRVPSGITLLEAARHLGVEIESICGGRQTCGKCKIVVEEGAFARYDIASHRDHLTPPGDREANAAERFGLGPSTRLSCACQVLGDLVIRVPEESQTRKQVVRKGPGFERKVNVDAPMRLFYVELPPGELRDHRGDWERLRSELAAVHGLEHLRIDLAALTALQPALRAGKRGVTVTVHDRKEVVRVQPGFHDAIYGLAVDVGTTTLAGHLCHLRTGEIVATANLMNPQVPFGEDLMSRVSYAMAHPDGTQRMHQIIIDGINALAAEACAAAGITPDQVIEMVVVGNTTMHHLVLGIDPSELGGLPFSLATHDALDVKARDLGLALAPGANVHLPPCEAGHVGADNVGVLVAETPYNQDELMLILDVGTNGELLLGDRRQVLSASSPTGPAFEGAQIRHGMRAAEGAIERVRIDPATLEVRWKVIGHEDWTTSASQPEAEQLPTAPPAAPSSSARSLRRAALLHPALRAAGICGSGVIEAVAELLLAGLITPSGRFVPIQHPRLRLGQNGTGKAEFVLAWPHETLTGAEIVVHADDVRAVQLAKAALYAGAKLLMHRLGIAAADRIVLAGGFGSYIDPRHAMIIGLIPDAPLARVQAVGNAAGDGARMILLDGHKREEARWAARWVTYVETAGEPEFQEEFVAALPFPHGTDAFPQVAGMLEEARGHWDGARSEAWREAQRPRSPLRSRSG